MQAIRVLENVLLMHIQIININGLKYTKKLIFNLLNQNFDGILKITIVDQGSTEKGTKRYFDFMENLSNNINVVRNKENININVVWNKFYQNTKDNYLCFLNNDVSVPKNFVKDTVQILNTEPYVGCVVHATNNPQYSTPTRFLKYVIPNKKFAQGWDFTIRRNLYTPIPKNLDTFGGDDWLFSHMYKMGYSTAIALSSPIIHYWGKSRKYFKGDRKKIIDQYKKYKNAELLDYNKDYSWHYAELANYNSRIKENAES